MSARGHTAVMASQRDEESSKGLFPTPPWATRALMENIILPRYGSTANQTVWEPACGKGHMAWALDDYFAHLFATDIERYGFGGDPRDFLFSTAYDAPWPVDWVITNPPFPLAEAFLFKALTIARVGVALLVRVQWLEGDGRYSRVWNSFRPDCICPFAERVPMIEGVWDPEASSATAYMWVVWSVGAAPEHTQIVHIPPGQADRLSRISDLALATPGAAKRRKKARETAQDRDAQPSLFGGDDDG